MANNTPSRKAPQPPLRANPSPLPLKPNEGSLNLLPSNMNNPMSNNAGPRIHSPYLPMNFCMPKKLAPLPENPYQYNSQQSVRHNTPERIKKSVPENPTTISDVFAYEADAQETLYFSAIFLFSGLEMSMDLKTTVPFRSSSAKCDSTASFAWVSIAMQVTQRCLP